jgi:hypothetical protein
MSSYGAQLVVGIEGTYGTAVSGTHALEFVKESIAGDYQRIESVGVRKNTRFLRATRFVPYAKGAKGDIEIELLGKGHEFLLPALLGTATSNTPASGTTVWTAIPGSYVGQSYTVQVGRPDLSDTVHPFTYAGGKVDSWELSNKAGELLNLKSTWSFASEVIGGSSGAYALATADYSRTDNAELFSFVGGQVKIGSTAVNVNQVTIKVDNALKTDRFVINTPIRAEPVEDGHRKIEIDFDLEFEDLTHVNRFAATTAAGTLAAGTFTWQCPTPIAGTGGTIYPTLKVTIPAIRFDGDLPNVDGAKLLDLKLKGSAVDNGTDQVCTIQYTTEVP